MFHPFRLAAVAGGLAVGCLLMLGLAGGQDGPAREKGKKDKGAKWGEVDPEAKAVFKAADRATKPVRTERDEWLKELVKAFPGQVSPGLTEADFAQWFALLSGGGAEWRRESFKRDLFDRTADRLGLGPVPAITRDQFLAYARGFLLPDRSPPWKADPPADAEKAFRALDRDGSGFLEPTEWTDALRSVAGRVDADRDGRISPAEYRMYFENRVAAAIESGPAPPAPTPFQPTPPTAPPPPVKAKPAEEPKLVAVRFGKLPPGLPDWFAELDLDQDGQIGLYEWRRAGRPMAEFQAMDLNGDGLLPADEYLRFARLQNPETTAAPSGNPPPGGKPGKKK